jgi:hypothetical protein
MTHKAAMPRKPSRFSTRFKDASYHFSNEYHVIYATPLVFDIVFSSFHATDPHPCRNWSRGWHSLVGNSAYRRYIKTCGKSFEIDLGKLADEARFDGITVLRTNAKVTPLQAVIRYRELLQVESLFRAAKASFDTRPIFHQSDAAIRGQHPRTGRLTQYLSQRQKWC